MRGAPASRPRLLVVAGPNGAGKTTITERGLAHEWFHDCEYVNPDAIAQDELGDWNDAETVLRAARLATERREACLREGRALCRHCRCGQRHPARGGVRAAFQRAAASLHAGALPLRGMLGHERSRQRSRGANGYARKRRRMAA
jgi:hypothetical protein